MSFSDVPIVSVKGNDIIHFRCMSKDESIYIRKNSKWIIVRKYFYQYVKDK